MLTKSKNRATLKTSRCLQKPENKPQSTCWLYADLIGILIILLQKGEPTTQWYCKTGRGNRNMQIWENVNTGTNVFFPRRHMTSHPHSSCTSVAVFFPPSSWWRIPFFPPQISVLFKRCVASRPSSWALRRKDVDWGGGCFLLTVHLLGGHEGAHNTKPPFCPHLQSRGYGRWGMFPQSPLQSHSAFCIQVKFVMPHLVHRSPPSALVVDELIHTTP